jgi:hypothetical protein
MSKPEFSKSFNAEHAKAGAPYCCSDGKEATVLKWDARWNEFPIIGVIGTDDRMTSWTSSGRYHSDANDSQTDLVMLPLGMIDGKPVFVGDPFIDGMGNNAVAQANYKNFAGSKWPPAAKAYPVTQMPQIHLVQIHQDILNAPGPGGGRHAAAVGVANAALRHAVDNGYLVTLEEARAAYKKGYIAGDGHAEKERAARDMAVAEAVRSSAAWLVAGHFDDVKIMKMDVAAIIAGMPS